MLKWFVGFFFTKPIATVHVRVHTFRKFPNVCTTENPHGSNLFKYTSLLIHNLHFALVTFTVFHYPEQDIQVGGYDVPKDTLMMIECKAPCRDKQFWKDPEVFNPDRFLGIDGEGQLPEGCFIPYGEGKYSVSMR